MEPRSIHVERLTAARRDHFLRFFDHEHGPAFADNPAWSACYCHYFHVPKVLDWSAFTGGQNRVAMAARIEVGEQEGYLALAGDEVVGWVNAQPYHKLPHACARLGVAPPPLDVPAFAAAAILCFVIAPTWRRQGVARALLDGALVSFAARGFHLVDAFPLKGDHNATPQDHYHGPAALFVEAGFTVLSETDEVTVMRRRLAQPGA